MRIIPKKTKVKNTIWRCYSLKDILIALGIFILVFLLLINKRILISIILILLFLIMYIPTPEGIFYNFVFENLKFFFSKKSHTNKILLFDKIDEKGIIRYKNGIYGKVIRIGQKNFGIEDVVEQDLDINYFASALKQLDINQFADIVKIDRAVNFDSYSKDIFNRLISLKLDKKDKKRYEIKKNILKERIDYIDTLNNVFKQYVSEYYIVIYGNKEDDLEITTSNLETEIKKCGVDTKVLNQKEVAVFIKYCYSKDFDEREVNDLTNEELIAWCLPQKIKIFSNKYYIDNLEASTMTISDYPLRVKNAWGNNIFNIPNTKVVMRVKNVEKLEAIKRIDQCITELETKVIASNKTSESKELLIHKETMNSLLSGLQSENESLLDTSLTITTYNYLNDSNYKRKVKKVIMNDNFKFSTLYSKQLDGFLASNITPECHIINYERGINSSSLAAVFPFIRTYVMDEGGILLGKNKNNDYPFIFNIWKRGNLYQNSNAMIIGKSGSGKSFFLKNMIVHEWSNNTRIIICDPDAEYVGLTKNLCGNVVDVGNSKEGRINPFHVYQILTEDGKMADSIITFNTHLKMLESFFKIVLEDADDTTIEIINNLVIEAYVYKGITKDTNFLKLKAKDYPTFKDLLIVLKSKNSKTKNYLLNDELKKVELYLQKFITGRYSDIWNHPSTLEVNANIINFNFQSLFASKNNIVANAQMLLIFRFIEQEIINARGLNRKGLEVKTMIICDEAHLFIDPKYPIALDFFYQMNKRIRKYNGSFIPATQNISDWNGNEELKNKTSTILKNSQYMFIFKLSAPDMKDVVDIYKAGDGFNEEEQRIIVSAGTGEAFFIGSTELRASIKIIVGEYIKKLFDER